MTLQTFPQFGNRPIIISKLNHELTIDYGGNKLGKKGGGVERKTFRLQHFQYISQRGGVHMTQETYGFLVNAEIVDADETFACVNNLPVRIVPHRYPIKMGVGYVAIQHDQKLGFDGFMHMTRKTYDHLLDIDSDNEAAKQADALVEVE